MSRFSNSFCILFLTIQWLDFCLPAAIGNNPLDITDQLVNFRVTLDQESNYLLPELELQLLQAQQQEDDLRVVRMQLMQLNLLKLLIALDCFILLCIYLYAREGKKYHPVQNV
ncbi:uncharacterized protein [Drosophila takahashii]|uniref:uncharacterized protein n=1 Tax=Drosophila takahashii TaxID=29030 RepID=UPI001CF84119|nr:uncharacterized protein LOC108065542 [Drosophila takahashii]